MTKAFMDTFIAALTTAGVTSYNVRCEGANRIVSHNGDNRLILEGDNSILALEITSNNINYKGGFDLKCVPYDDIEDIYSMNLSVKQVISILTTYGLLTDDARNMISKYGARYDIKPGTNGLAIRADSDGNAILDSNISATATKGDAPSVTAVADPYGVN